MLTRVVVQPSKICAWPWAGLPAGAAAGESSTAPLLPPDPAGARHRVRAALAICCVWPPANPQAAGWGHRAGGVGTGPREGPRRTFLPGSQSPTHAPRGLARRSLEQRPQDPCPLEGLWSALGPEGSSCVAQPTESGPTHSHPRSRLRRLAHLAVLATSVAASRETRALGRKGARQMGSPPLHHSPRTEDQAEPSGPSWAAPLLRERRERCPSVIVPAPWTPVTVGDWLWEQPLSCTLEERLSGHPRGENQTPWLGTVVTLVTPATREPEAGGRQILGQPGPKDLNLRRTAGQGHSCGTAPGAQP